MTVYADILFLVNAAVDYLLFRVGAKLCAYPLSRRRALLAALFGGLFALAQLAPVPLLHTAWCKGLSFLIMAALAFGIKRRALRPTALTLLCSSALAGVFLILVRVFSVPMMILRGTVYYPVTAKVLILVSGLCYLLCAACFAGALRHSAGEVVPLRLALDGRIMEVPSLYDTGNGLRDPMSGKGVVVLSPACFAELVGLPSAVIPDDPIGALSVLSAHLPESAARLVPYRAVGAKGLLPAVGCTAQLGKKRKPVKVLAARSPTPMAEGGYEALIGGTVA